MITQPDLNEMIHSLTVHSLLQDCTLCHKDYTVFASLEGTLQVSVEKTNHLTLNAPGLILLPPAQHLTMHPLPSCTCVVLQLSPAFILAALPYNTILTTQYDSFSHPILQKMVTEFAVLAGLYAGRRDIRNDYEIIGQLYRCLGKLQDFFLSLNTSPKSAGKTPLERRNQEIHRFLEANIRSVLSLQATAEKIGITPQYLSAFFQKNYHCTFMDYVNQQKAIIAEKWLLYTDLSDTEIASVVGFKTTASFQKTIQALLGTTTDTLRKRQALPMRECPLPGATLDSDALSSIPAFNRSEADPLPAADLPARHPDRKYIRIVHEYLTPLPDMWNKILNIGHAYHLSDSRLRSQLIQFQNQFHFRYGRICRPFDLATLREIGGKSYYGFDALFRILDLMLSLALIPFLEIGNKSTKINTKFSEIYFFSANEDAKAHYGKLLQVLPEFIKSSCNRYGVETVSTWHFEVYFDNITTEHARLSLSQYLSYYKRIEQTIHAIVPACAVGGPGYNTYVPKNDLDQFLQALASQKIRIDFFSIYAYACAGAFEQAHLSTDPDILQKRTRQAVRQIRERFPKLPVYVTEFNFSYLSRNFLNDSIFQSAFITRYLTQVLELVQGAGYYLMSDVSTRITDTDGMLFGGNGLFNYQGIRKPAYFAYAFYQELGKSIVSKGENYLITANSRYSYQGLFFHYTHINEKTAHDPINTGLLTDPYSCFLEASRQVLEFTIDGIMPGIYLVKSHRIGQRNGNLLSQWAKATGLLDLSGSDIAFFQQLSYPATEMDVLEATEENTLTFSVSMEPLDLLFLQITYNAPAPGQTSRKEDTHEL